MTRFEQARGLLTEGRYPEVRELLEGSNVVDGKKLNASEKTLLAVALINLGRAERAIEILKEVVAFAPDYLFARKSLARAYLSAGNPQSAELECDAILREKDDCATRTRLAWIRARSYGPYELKPHLCAVENCSEDPDEAVLIRAESWLTFWLYRQAGNVARSLSAHHEHDLRVHELLAHVAIGQRRYGDALSDLLPLALDRPSTAQGLAAWACFRSGNFRASVRWCREVQQDLVKRPWGLAMEVRSLLALGEKEKALTLASEAVEEYPNCHALGTARVLALWGSGRRWAAIKVQQQNLRKIFTTLQAFPESKRAS